MRLFATLCAASILASCQFNYSASDPEKLRAFLIDQNIYCPGDDRATTLALIDWSRRNLVHADDDQWIETNSKSMLQLLKESENNGFVLIQGCWGTADFFQQMLGSVNIRTIYNTLALNGVRHAKIDFPDLNATSLHADNLHEWKVDVQKPMGFSTSGYGEQEIPAEEILSPVEMLPKSGNAGSVERAKHDALISKYLPALSVYVRTRYYGKFYSEAQIKKDTSGELPITDVSLDPDILKMIDAEIDRLGGPELASTRLADAFDKPENHTKLIPVTPGKFCTKK